MSEGSAGTPVGKADHHSPFQRPCFGPAPRCRPDSVRKLRADALDGIMLRLFDVTLSRHSGGRRRWEDLLSAWTVSGPRNAAAFPWNSAANERGLRQPGFSDTPVIPQMKGLVERFR